MATYLARAGLAVFAMLFAMTLLTEQVAVARAVVTGTIAFDLPQLREVAPTRIDAAVIQVTVVAAPPIQDDAIVLASWYGPGFYGNQTACGQTYTPEIHGVAHLTLPCGTVLTLTYGSRSVTVPVIDRGPYIVGREIDLSGATKLALGCTDLCTLRMQIGR